MSSQSTGSGRAPRVVGLQLVEFETALYSAYAGAAWPSSSESERVVALARALASSPLWKEMPDAIMVVRTEPPAGIAVMGYLDDEDFARLKALPGQLQTELPRLRYLDWQEVEEGCEVLARRLLAELGAAAISQASFVGIPRGGILVLGLLAYVMDLKPTQLLGRAWSRGEHPREPGTEVDERNGLRDPHRRSPDDLLVVVDDCALSGLRFGRFLRAETQGPVAFAHLFSHPELRAQIQEREDSVTQVVAAYDLCDHAPELLGAEYASWRARWQERTRGAAYWIGRPDRLGFPWSEPEIGVWNQATQQEDLGWRLIPPSACLRNRIEGRAGMDRLQIQPHGSATHRLAPSTYFGQIEGHTILASLRSGIAVQLDPMASAIWHVLLEEPGVDEAARALSRAYDAEPGVIEEDVREMHRQFTDAGFLEELASATESPPND